MKQVLFYLLVCCAFGVRGQVITTVCGNSTATTYIDGIAATLEPLSSLAGGVFDKAGNYYFTLGCGGERICKLTNTGILYTIAGDGTGGFIGDNGPGKSAQLQCPNPPCLDTFNNVYFPDKTNNRIRKIDAITGVISTIAGNGIVGISPDGTIATNSKLYYPNVVCMDKLGNLYFSDDSNRICKINHAGVISTIAGIRTPGFSGDGAAATLAKIWDVSGMAYDNFGNLIIVDYGNKRIRKISTTGIITTIAGNGNYLYNGDNIPATTAQFDPLFNIALDNNGSIYFSDNYNNRIRQIDKYGIIHTVAGTGVGGYSGDGFLATNAKISNPEGVAIDACENLYIADNYNGRIRKLTYNPPPCDYLNVRSLSSGYIIHLYPNPTTSTLQIDNLKTTTQYQLYNMLGATISQDTLKPGNNTLPLDALQPGIYMLALIDEEGEKTVHKVVKE